MVQRKPRPVVESSSGERPTVEFLTIGWMLAVVTALVCELGLVAARSYLLVVDGEAARMTSLAAILLFASLVVGLVVLGLGYAVVRSRRVPPPRGIVVFASVVGAAPLAALLLRALFSGLTTGN